MASMSRKTGISYDQGCGVADPHHFNANPDPAFHFNANPDPAFHFNADLGQDPAPHRSDGNPRPLVYRSSKAHFRHLDFIVRVLMALHGSTALF